jgi:hypothetical protein
MATNRIEVALSYTLQNNRQVTFIVRDKISPDDVIVNRSRAKLLALRASETLDIVRVSRNVKDLMIRTNVAT